MPTTNPTTAYSAPASMPSSETVPPESRCAVVSHHASDIRMESKDQQYHDRLTSREVEVAALTHLGNSQIAELLGITEATVKVHLRNVFAKTGAETRTAAYALVMRRGPEMERTGAGYVRRSA